MDDKTKKLIEKAQIEDTLKQEFALTLEQRVKRYLELRPHGIIPNSHFAAVSAECHSLYRDGHFYGTISLAQSVAEALVKFLCERNGWKPNKDFEKNLKQLETRGKISQEIAYLFNEVWKSRDDYHHLNPQIEQDRQKLEVLAKEKLSNLRNIEQELFAYSANEGKIVPKYPKYWDQKNGTVPVFLRLD
jgi:hypothetical protein